MLYQAYQLQSDMTTPWRLLAQHLGAPAWLQREEHNTLRMPMAALDVLARMRLTHSRPSYQIETVEIGNRVFEVEEEVALSLPFGSLLHFKKSGADHLPYQPPVLLAAPLSGHFATRNRAHLAPRP
jgi:poly(3-hydroxybutyrate) depolymerase